MHAFKSHVKGNCKDGKKSKHKRSIYLFKTQLNILFNSNQSSDNVATKNITQKETSLDPDPVQKTTNTVSNSSKPKQVQTKFFQTSKPVQKVGILK